MTIYQQQCLLAYLGYPVGLIDGVWGVQTANAVRQFQRDYSLEVDGVCGQLTEKMLLGVVSGTVAQKETVAPTNTETSTVVQDACNTGTFWDTIRWFRREEFRCKCGGQYCNGYPAEMQEYVVRIADAAREHFKRPAHVVSGLRCPKWNAHEDGKVNSQHMYGEAIDLRIDDVDSETLRQFVSQQPNHRYSYRINGTNVHFDIVPRGR